MAKPNFGFQKRQKEQARAEKKAEKLRKREADSKERAERRAQGLDDVDPNAPPTDQSDGTA